MPELCAAKNPHFECNANERNVRKAAKISRLFSTKDILCIYAANRTQVPERHAIVDVHLRNCVGNALNKMLDKASH